MSLRDSLKADLRQPHVVFGTSTRGDPDRERHGAGERRGVRAPPTSRRPSGAPITRRERGGPGRGRDAGERRGVRTPGRGAGSARWFVVRPQTATRPVACLAPSALGTPRGPKRDEPHCGAPAAPCAPPNPHLRGPLRRGSAGRGAGGPHSPGQRQGAGHPSGRGPRGAEPEPDDEDADKTLRFLRSKRRTGMWCKLERMKLKTGKNLGGIGTERSNTEVTAWAKPP